MKSIVIQQSAVIMVLVAILCIALLVSLYLILGSIIGAHASHPGIMIIATPNGIA